MYVRGGWILQGVGQYVSEGMGEEAVGTCRVKQPITPARHGEGELDPSRSVLLPPTPSSKKI
jgi:hypothetical protein